jgi:hypothetical protein
MRGTKASKNHETTGPQAVRSEKSSQATATASYSTPAIGNRALRELLDSKVRIRVAGPQMASARMSGTGSALPGQLQSALESFAGIDLSDVRVHRNSSRPAKLEALAYTSGSNIHLGPGQDNHLPHEAWHVVQQKQGRVKQTSLARGVAINDDVQLEHEADRMGDEVARLGTAGGERSPSPRGSSRVSNSNVVQRKIKISGLDAAKRNKFLAKINDGSQLEYELDASGLLQQKDKKKTATDEYSKQIVAAIADGQEVIVNLTAKDDTVFVDSFAGGEVDYADMMAMTANMFRTNFLHVVVERFAIPDYEKKKATAPKADYDKAHGKALEAEERLMKSWFPKKTIKFKSAGFNAATKKVDKAGNGTIDYEFDFTDVKQVYTQSIVANATKEDIVSSKIVVVK